VANSLISEKIAIGPRHVTQVADSVYNNGSDALGLVKDPAQTMP
jgi:hypothetical protein